MVAHEPQLLLKVLERVGDEGVSGSDTARHVVAQALDRTARAVDPTTVAPASGHRRDGSEWAKLLAELSTQLANGQLYNRDLPTLDQPLADVVDRYLRRRGG